MPHKTMALRWKNESRSEKGRDQREREEVYKKEKSERISSEEK
jgi:hypothetical protein